MSSYKGYMKGALHVPTSQPIPGRESEMEKNKAGGYSFTADLWVKLRRFLITGSDNPTFYASEKELTLKNASTLVSCIKADGKRVVSEIFEVSVNGLALKQDQGIFALAMVIIHSDPKLKVGQDALRAAYDAIPGVCRTASTMFQLLDMLKAGGKGWSAGLRRAVCAWYLTRDSGSIAYQMVKYRERNGFTHRDALMLAHPKTSDAQINAVLRWAAHPDQGVPEEGIIQAFIEINSGVSVAHAAKLITTFHLPREAVPTTMLNEVAIWAALLEDMPVHALIRNLNKMSALGMFLPFSSYSKLAVERLTHRGMIKKAKVHPIAVMLASKQYQAGAGEKGALRWDASQTIIDALESTFEYAFDNVEPIDKNVLVAVDTSGSMSNNMYRLSSGFLPIEAAAAIASVYTRVQPSVYVIGVDTIIHEDLSIGKNSSLQGILKWASTWRGGGTNLGLVPEWAVRNKIEVDAIFMISDGEDWAGQNHLTLSLNTLRNQRPVKMVNLQTYASETQISDPRDVDVMEMAGFSPDNLTVANAFFSGKI